MAEKLAPVAVSAVLFQEGEWWSAQCLEYDITAQAKTLSDLHYELARVLISHVVVSTELGQEPFAGLGSAPQKFWDLYDQAKLRIEGDEPPFRVPHPGAFPQVVPKLRIADQRIA